VFLVNNQVFHQDINFVSGLSYDKIGKHPIFIGPYPQNESDIDNLFKRGVTCVLNVQTDLDMVHRQIDWNLNLSCYKKRNIKIVRHPIQDFSPEDLKMKLFQANKILHDLIEEKHLVYVHCTAGMSRAAATVIGYLVIFLGYTLDQAYEYTKSYRSVIAPNMKVLTEVTDENKGRCLLIKNIESIK